MIKEFSGYVIEWGTYGRADKSPNSSFCFLPGAFDEALSRGGEIVLTCDCSHRPIYARRSDDTLEIECDDKGLIAHVKLIDSPLNRKLAYMIDHGYVKGWSHVWEPDFGGFRIRRDGDHAYCDHFRCAELSEVSLVIHREPRMKKSLPVFF